MSSDAHSDNIKEPSEDLVKKMKSVAFAEAEAEAKAKSEAKSQQPTNTKIPSKTDDSKPFGHNLTEACSAIAKHYNRTFNELRFIPPYQVTDGSVIDFADGETGKLVASGRLRFLNAVTLSKDNGALFVRVVITDLAFGQDFIKLAVKNE